MVCGFMDFTFMERVDFKVPDLAITGRTHTHMHARTHTRTHTHTHTHTQHTHAHTQMAGFQD